MECVRVYLLTLMQCRLSVHCAMATEVSCQASMIFQCLNSDLLTCVAGLDDNSVRFVVVVVVAVSR